MKNRFQMSKSATYLPKSKEKVDMFWQVVFQLSRLFCFFFQMPKSIGFQPSLNHGMHQHSMWQWFSAQWTINIYHDLPKSKAYFQNWFGTTNIYGVFFIEITWTRTKSIPNQALRTEYLDILGKKLVMAGTQWVGCSVHSLYWDIAIICFSVNIPK